MNLTDEQLTVINNCKDDYLKLLTLISISSKDEKGKKIMNQIFRNTYKIDNKEDRYAYLLFSYLAFYDGDMPMITLSSDTMESVENTISTNYLEEFNTKNPIKEDNVKVLRKEKL